MNENFLAFIWKYRIYQQPLFTTDGKQIDVLSPGMENPDSGPDFFNARLRIDTMIWVGNVEIHNKASDWYLHNHQSDPAFNNTVLHVVYDSNSPVTTNVGFIVPQLELKQFLTREPVASYQRMMETLHWIPCEAELNQTDSLIVEKMLERSLVERLEEKTAYIRELLQRWNGDWMQVFFIVLAKAFGARVNASAFELMAQATPVSLVLKNADNLNTLEALLFGQAGLLSEQFEDPYPQNLLREYRYLKHKYNLHTIPYSCWKFMRIRPSGFPTVRISQLAAFYHKNYRHLSSFLNAPVYDQLLQAFDIHASQYWDDHLRFDQNSVCLSKNLGADAINGLIINAVANLSFCYLKDFSHEKAAMIPDLLYDMPPENNNVIRKWNKIAGKIHSAGHSQAVLHLKKNYCEQKKCLNCLIGHAVIRDI
ncbi:MAG: DUF2851 domain-containing protein [Marinilabiliales bacterium]|nr:MAG: DUF2851 domain-containing protein [Marinilabiliales bacterium]